MQDQPIPRGLCQCGCGRPTNPASHTDRKRGWIKGEPIRFVKGHHIAVYNRIHKRKPGPRYIVDENGCWIWQLYINPHGYGVVSVGSGKSREAHRVFYEERVGPVPDGLVLDHLCRTRSCVNPEHLEPVTIKENILRGEGMGARYARRTHCAKGHPLSGDNLYVYPNGVRRCRTCRRESGQ